MKQSFPDLRKQSKTAVLWLLLFPLLPACSLFQPAPNVDGVKESYQWSDLQPRLQAMSNWSLQGKLGVRTKDDAFSAAINKWVQIEDHFVIDLASTFMNLGATRLSGNSRYIVLTESGEAPLESDQPQQVLTEVLGAPLPIEQLKYWIKGIPAPDREYTIHHNSNGLTADLNQAGWHIRYKKYQHVNQLPLPGKIILENPPNRIVVAIHQWQF